MNDQMARLRHESEERWPIKGAPRDSLESARQSYRAGARQGFIAGRTISREQFNWAAWAVRESSESTMAQVLPELRIAFEAAGLVIEDE